jgi:probable HAF family extracellular repeat protein
MRNTTWASLLLAAGLAAGAPAPAVHGEEPAPEPPPPEYALFDLGPVTAVDIDDAGRVLVNQIGGLLGNDSLAFVIEVGEDGELLQTSVPGFGPETTFAGDISPSGIVVGHGIAGAEDIGPPGDPFFVTYARAYSWSGGATTNLEHLPPTGAGGTHQVEFESQAYGVNDAGVVVGASAQISGAQPRYPFRWENGVMTRLGTALVPGTARAINANGVIVGEQGEFVRRACLWTPGNPLTADIDAAGAFFTEPTDINSSDEVVGTREVIVVPDPPRSRPFYTALAGRAVARDELLPLLMYEVKDPVTEVVTVKTAKEGSAEAINDFGVIVGWSASSDVPGRTRAVLWRSEVVPPEYVVEDLQAYVDTDKDVSPGIPRKDDGTPADYSLLRAVGINAGGDIACVGAVGPPGTPENHSFLLRRLENGLTIGPRRLDFGTITIGTRARQTLSFRNDGLTPFVIKLAKPPKPFAVGEEKFLLRTGESHDVKVTAQPLDGEPHAAELEILVIGTDGEGRTVKIPLDVEGEPPIEVTPSRIDFGVVRGEAWSDIRVENLAEFPVKVTMKARKPYAVGAKSFTLNAGQVATVALLFAPQAAADYAAQIEIRTNVKKAGAVLVPVTGQGVGTLQVLRVSGAIRTRRANGEWRNLEVGDELVTGDEIESLGGTADVVTPDGSEVHLNSAAKTGVATLVQDPSTKRFSLRLVQGSIEVKSKMKKGKKNHLTVQTHVCIVSALKGTEFSVSYDPERKEAKVTTTSGEVFVVPSNFRLKRGYVRAGEDAVIGELELIKVPADY